MALWGDKELIATANNGTIAIAQGSPTTTGTVTGTSTTFDSTLTVGNYIACDNKEYRVTAIASDTSCSVVAGLTGDDVTAVSAGATYTVSEKPIYLSAGSTGNRTTDNANQVFFVDETEIAVAGNEDKGIYGAGWMKYDTYTNALGDTRYKTELLVAMRRTQAEAGDSEDSVVADS